MIHVLSLSLFNPSSQVDWEAILSQHPDDFAAAVGKWLYPDAARVGTSQEGGAGGGTRDAPSLPDVSSFPLVAQVIPTPRHRIEILNGEGMKRI